MKRRHSITLLLVGLGLSLLLTSSLVVGADAFRFWTTNDGRRSDTRLRVVEQSEDRVKLEREDDGRVVELPLERLSGDDRRFLRALAEEQRVEGGRADESRADASGEFQPDREGFATVAEPFLRSHCLRCHGPEQQQGGFRVDRQLPNEFLDHAVVEWWSEVLNVLNAGQMPPDGEPQPPAADVRRFVEWIEGERRRGQRARKPAAVVMRRMNRHEYNNTIRDLIGIQLDLVDDFPEDPPVGGFDNNGGALTISPLHLERYLMTARKILDQAIVDEARGPGTIHWHFELEDGVAGSDRRRVRLDDERNRSVHLECGSRPPIEGMVLMRFWGEASRVQYFTPPRAGEYRIRIHAAGATPPDEDVRRAGVELEVRRQEERESKLAEEAERRKSRENFEAFSLPYIQRHFEQDRRYVFGPPRLRVLGFLGSRKPILAEFDVEAPRSEPKTYEVAARLTTEKSSLCFTNEYRIPGHWFLGMNNQHDDFPRPELFIDWVEIEGPVYDAWPPSSHTRILIDSPHKDAEQAAYARDVLANFMRRAYRRPLRQGEVEPLLALFEQVRPEKPSFEEAIKVPLTAVLASPHFLFLVEGDGAAGDRAEQPLDDFQLASRLSYFLWSSMPDDELIRLARAGELDDPRTLREQLERMLADERSNALIKNFTGQWLELRKVGANPPVSEIYKRYDDHLESSMRGETEAFFEHILRGDRSVLEFLDCDYVVINERLARFYGIPAVRGDHFRAVAVPEGVPRGGLVTQASILSLTSNGTRTSPVWRGVWMLRNLLGDPPPPPPPNAGDVPPGVPGLDKVTVRQRLQFHRQQPQCARCHEKIDALGFALENFAANGEWRDHEHRIYMDETMTAGLEIDSSAQMPSGARIDGVDGLRAELLHQQDQFLRCLVGKMYTYALGREMGAADEPVIEEAVAHMKAHDNTLRSLLHHIVASDRFRRK
ncbi:MAG: DUF1592 domain-containing protein [Pirellulaceae bacterium]